MIKLNLFNRDANEHAQINAFFHAKHAFLTQRVS